MIASRPRPSFALHLFLAGGLAGTAAAAAVARAPATFSEDGTAGKRIPGVVVGPSTHLRRGLGAVETPATLSEVFVDVGASSRAEATSLGVELIQPIVPERRITRPGTAERVAGPGVASKA